MSALTFFGGGIVCEEQVLEASMFFDGILGGSLGGSGGVGGGEWCVVGKKELFVEKIFLCASCTSLGDISLVTCVTVVRRDIEIGVRRGYRQDSLK